MDRLVEHLFVFEGNGLIRDFPGNYSDYRSAPKYVAPVEKTKPEKESVSMPPAQKGDGKKLTFKEKFEMETLEKEIPEWEKKKSTIQAQLLEETEYQKLDTLGKELKQIEDELAEKEMRWLELSERIS
jgi:ATP-binding cassette subfamily F protein uup